MKKPFHTMSHDERVAAVRALMNAKHSNKTAAKKLGVKPGVVAGIRWRSRIPSKHPAGFKALAKSSSGVVLKLSLPGPTQCIAKTNGHQCAYVKMPGSEYCGLPGHQRLGKKRRA